MNLSGVSRIFQCLYTDRVSISRLQEVKESDGTTRTEVSKVPLYKDIPCRISFSSGDNPEGSTDSVNPEHLQIKVFCASDVDVRKGDTIIADRLDEAGNVISSYRGTANLPACFVTHKEILLVQTGEA